MKETFKGDSPKNARIKIDYSGVKPDVRFSYPSKKKQAPGGAFAMVIFFWIIVYGFLIVGYSVGKEAYRNSGQDLNISYNISNYSDYVRYFEEENILNQTYDIIYEKHNSNFFEKLWIAFKEDLSIEPLIMILLLIIPPIPIYLLFKKSWDNLYPKLQASFAPKKKAIFKPNDVEHNEKWGYYCEIPVFDNVILNYEAKEEFSKYLKYFEIEEHKFRYFKRRKTKKRDRTINEWLWYARFYFSDKPKTGKLEVIFK